MQTMEKLKPIFAYLDKPSASFAACFWCYPALYAAIAFPLIGALNFVVNSRRILVISSLTLFFLPLVVLFFSSHWFRTRVVFIVAFWFIFMGVFMGMTQGAITASISKAFSVVNRPD
jgi:hypothetical protein